MAENASACVYCAATDNEAPLIAFRFQGTDYHICPQHLPFLIHEPAKLAGKLPGAENLVGRKGH